MKKFARIACLILVVVALITPATHAAEQGSQYFTCYDAWIEFSYITPRLELWFDVTGTNTMDEIGVYSIDIMESTDGVNFTTIDTFYPASFSNMMDYNSIGHMDYVTFYNAVPGRYYKTYVTFWGKLGEGAGMATTYSDAVRVN